MGFIRFFSLSGLLITYLLLEEATRTGTIRIRKFYLRRILTIWPLYDLIVLLGFLLLPLTTDLFTHPQIVASVGDSLPKVVLFLALLPNPAWVIFGIIPLMGPLWSVGVEEQFYLLWPLLLGGLQNRILLGIVVVIVVMVATRFALPPSLSNSVPASRGTPDLFGPGAWPCPGRRSDCP
jgi:peptidoglycan/LPS O-acetylase OafA/YrhL